MEILKTEPLDGGGVREWMLVRRRVDLSGMSYYHDWRDVYEVSARDRVGDTTTLRHPVASSGSRELALERWNDGRDPGKVATVLEKRACGA